MNDKSNTAAEVHSIVGRSQIPVEPDERALLEQVLGQVAALQSALGAERERYHREEEAILSRLSRARERYEGMVDLLAHKHVKTPGKFTFRPDLGAFIASGHDPQELAAFDGSRE